MIPVILNRPWLEFDLGGELRVVSWALNRPGFVNACRILWREVANADFSKHFDVRAWLHQELMIKKAQDAVVFLTSRNLACHTMSQVIVGSAEVTVVATVGLSNAERVGTRLSRPKRAWGTVNVGVRVNQGMSDTAMLESLSIAVQARTAAILDCDLKLTTGPATGTGTDCLALAAIPGTAEFAGMHTDVGEAVGRAVYAAVRDGARGWLLQKRNADKPGYKDN